MALSKGTATDYLDLVDELDAFVEADWVDTVAVNAGGTGYAVDDVLTVAGGTVTHHAAQVVVTAVSSGVITAIRLLDSGGYSADPTLTGNSVTGGTGSGATIDITMESDPWTIELASTIETTEEVRIYSGTGGGGVTVGFRTYQEDTGARQARNWALFGTSSYNGALAWYQQPDITVDQGFSTVDGTMSTSSEGCYLVLKDNDGTAMDYWFYVTNRRIIVIAKLVDGVTTTPRYASCYLGLLNPLGTSSEFPYPLFIAGCAGDSQTAWDDLAPAFQFSGLTHLVGVSGNSGPAAYFSVDGAWKDVKNKQAAYPISGAVTETNDYSVSPCGQMDVNARPVGENIAYDGTTVLQFEQFINVTGSLAAAPTYEFWPTPDSGGAKRLLVPCVLTMSNAAIAADYTLVGELDGVYWVSGAGSTLLTPEDTIDDSDNSEFHVCFPNGVYRQVDGYFAVRES